VTAPGHPEAGFGTAAEGSAVKERPGARSPFPLLLLLLLLVSPLPARDDTHPGVFRIQPVRPVAELRREALAATPPLEKGPFRPVDLVDVAALDPTILLDLRYATSDNFLGVSVYEPAEARAYLQRPAAEAVARVHRALRETGHGLLIHDAYRPWWVTRLFWDATPSAMRDFVADPAKGSRHNRGCAVDLTLYSLTDGRAVEMPSLYDEMSERSHPTWAGGTPEQRRRRDLLRAAMEREGFAVFEWEWWHFDHRDWRQYPILNVPLARIGR
jgi:D-alanyl-D-alanine dipeptidase